MSSVDRENLWRRLLEGWTAVAGRFGAVQTLVVLGLFYGLLIGPVALVSRAVGSDPLRRRPLGNEQTGWSAADTAPADLQRAQRLS